MSEELNPATHNAPLNWHVPADYAEAVEMLRRAKRDLENPAHALLMVAAEKLKEQEKDFLMHDVVPDHCDAIELLEKLASEYPPAVCVPVGQWRPIETAPKDKSVLLFAPYGVMYCGRKRYGTSGEPSQDSFEWRCDSSGRFANPTHWAPLLDAPTTAARKP